jgi:isopenicillin-N epimerase
LKSRWCLNPEIDFLNHGSFGAVPRIVLDEQVRLRGELERDPIRFLAPERELEPKLDDVRRRVAKCVGATASNVAFVRNATDGVNAVLRSMKLNEGDEVVVTNHGYNACINAVRFVAERAKATTRVAEVPFPIASPDEVVDAIAHVLSDRTRLVLVDHVTSPTALVFPVDRIIELARQRGVRVMIDGAHAPGMLRLELEQMGADFYAANHHKWLCAPKASGFLYARPECQSEVHPTIISHAYNRPRPGRSRFLAEFDWMGTHDPTPLLCVPAALDFLNSLNPQGLIGQMEVNRILALQSQHVLCEAIEIPRPCPQAMIGAMAAVPLEGIDLEAGVSLARDLYEQERIEVPIFAGIAKPGERETEVPPLLRVSLQAYNDLSQVQRLAESLRRHLPRLRRELARRRR